MNDGCEVEVLSDVVVNCSKCGDEVALMESELVDGQPPKNYVCSECA